jgi:hypothetical protein
MVVALIALFIALGGPAQARKLIDGHELRKGSVTGRAIKDHSIAKVDLTKSAVRSLTATPAGSVGSSQIIDGQVLAPDLGAGAVTASKLAADSVGGGSVANGSLQTVDIGSFAGSLRAVSGFSFSRDAPCQVVQGPAISAGGQPNISDDVVVVTPPAEWPDTVVVTGKPAPNNQVRIVACWIPQGDGDTPPNVGTPIFNYVTFDSP